MSSSATLCAPLNLRETSLLLNWIIGSVLLGRVSCGHVELPPMQIVSLACRADLNILREELQ